MELQPADVHAWWTQAQKVGEEKWLVDHALPTGSSEQPNEHIARVLRVKYPGRLPELYRTILQKRPLLVSCEYAAEIAASTLPREQKIALLEEGVAHRQPEHRRWALDGLATVDRPLFRKLLVKTLTLYPEDVLDVEPLVEKAADEGCWDALAAAAKRVPCGVRMELIRVVGWWDPPSRKDPIRRDRIRFLVQFLDDRSTAPDDDDLDWKMVEVRDYTVEVVAGLFGLRVWRNWGNTVVPDRHRGPISQLVFRETVRLLAEQELSRPRK
jgi:hypothetical protein